MSLPGLLPSLGGVVASGSGSGGGVGGVSITDQTLSAIGVATQAVSYRLNSAGTVQRGRNAVYNTLETWLITGAATDYEVQVSGSGAFLLTGGDAVNTWLSLGSNREWELAEGSSGGESIADLTVEIRLAAPPNTVIDTASVSLYAVAF